MLRVIVIASLLLCSSATVAPAQTHDVVKLTSQVCTKVAGAAGPPAAPASGQATCDSPRITFSLDVQRTIAAPPSGGVAIAYAAFTGSGALLKDVSLTPPRTLVLKDDAISEEVGGQTQAVTNQPLTVFVRRDVAAVGVQPADVTACAGTNKSCDPLPRLIGGIGGLNCIVLPKTQPADATWPVRCTADDGLVLAGTLSEASGIALKLSGETAINRSIPVMGADGSTLGQMNYLEIHRTMLAFDRTTH
jgi:hypothetical protein